MKGFLVATAVIGFASTAHADPKTFEVVNCGALKGAPQICLLPQIKMLAEAGMSVEDAIATLGVLMIIEARKRAGKPEPSSRDISMTMDEMAEAVRIFVKKEADRP